MEVPYRTLQNAGQNRHLLDSLPDWDRNPFRGLILVNIADEIPEGTTTTLPIIFTMAGNNSNVTVAGGDNLTVADFGGTGVYLVYYDRLSNVLQLI
jgi:hypothetical protein